MDERELIAKHKARKEQQQTTTSFDGTGVPTSTSLPGNYHTGGAGPDPLSRFRLRLYSEGNRSIASRTSIWLRYVAYFLTMTVACLITHFALNAAATTSYGGSLMWFSCFVMTMVAVGATVLYPAHRRETIDQYRHYTFGYALFPGTTIALILWALSQVISSPTASDDTLASLLGFAIPAIYVCTVVIPPIIFVKLIAGYHTMYKSMATDTEMVSSITRQDHLQR